MRKVLLTGGSGFIGSHLSEALEGKEVLNYDILPPSVETKATYLKGNIHDVEKLSNVLNGVDCVFHLAATHFDFQQNYERTNVAGTAAVIAAMEKADVKKIVFYSSVAVYGAIKKPTDENEEANPNMAYGQSKYDAELLLREWAEKANDRLLIIVRPTVVFGPHNFGNVFNLIKQIDSGVYFHIGGGTNTKSITYVKNLVLNTISLCKKLDTGVHVFNHIDEPQLNTRDLANAIASILNKSIKVVLPKWVAFLLAVPFDLLKRIFGINTPISRERIVKFTSSTHFIPRNLKLMGITTTIPVEEALKETITWYKNTDWEVLYGNWKDRVEKYN